MLESEYVGKQKPEIIQAGQKIVYLVQDNVRFVDSINFFGKALRTLPKTFSLPENVHKGWFPHIFSSKDKLNYVGPMPDVEYYGAGHMKRDELKAFEKWYSAEKAKHTVFNFRDELIKYCEQDVKVLMLSVIKFENLFEELTEVRPFTSTVTIAGACMRVFREKFLRPYTIAIIPHTGYRMANTASQVSLEWLSYQQSLLSPEDGKIIHAGNAREIKIGRYYVDGFLESKNIVYEFWGCFFHSHIQCYPQRDNVEMVRRYEETLNKLRWLEDNGYVVISIWECEYRALKQANPDIIKDYDRTIYMEPLRPRDAFFGGRTCAFKAMYNVSDDGSEKILYKDFCSLYPYINKTARYPSGHPVIYLRENHPPLETVCGLIKCTMLAPAQLLYGVLPVKIEDRLLFPLCKRCAETMSQGSCTHSDLERQLTGTWVSTEVQWAISRGYKMVQVFEIWHYPESSQFNAEDNTPGLFSDYVNTFLKGKMEASDWPAGCTTTEARAEFLSDFHAAEGIHLDPAKICDNPGLRSIFKSLLNSFW